MKPTFRASESDRTLSCYGSIKLAPMVLPRIGTDGSEGSHLHFYSASRLCGEFGANAPDGLGKADQAWPSIKVSKWIGDFYVRHIAQTVPESWSMECEVALAYEFDRFILSGHIDCLSVSPDGLECIGFDLKSGYDYVDEAECNEQVFCYCCLLKMAYPSLIKIGFYINQPRASEDDGQERVTYLELSGARLDSSVFTMETRFNHAIDNSMELNTGRKQCRFCPAKLQCPATIAEREQMKLQMTSAQLAAIQREPNSQTLADWVLSGKVVGAAIEQAQDIAKERIAATGSLTASDGTVISVKETNAGYKVIDKLGLWTALKETLPEEKLAECVSKWKFSAITDAIADHLQIAATGAGAMTGEAIRDAKVGQFVERTTAARFQFR